MDDRLYRSPTDRVIAGVAGGIAVWIGADPSIVRIAWVLGAIFSFGLFVLVYVVMMIVVPLAPAGWTPRPQPRATPGGNAVPGWGQGPGGTVPGPTTPGPTTPGAQASPGTQASVVPPTSPGTQASVVPPTSSGPQAGPAAAPAWQPSGQVPWDSAAAARRARLAGGTVLVILGLWLLVDQYVNIDWNLLWPLFVMGAGILLIAATLRRRGG